MATIWHLEGRGQWLLSGNVSQCPAPPAYPTKNDLVHTSVVLQLKALAEVVTEGGSEFSHRMGWHCNCLACGVTGVRGDKGYN